MATSGLHQSWWTPVYARSGNRLHSLQPCRSPRASHGTSSFASFLSTDRKPVRRGCLRQGPELREGCRVLLSQSGQCPEISRGSNSGQRAFPRNVDFPLVYALSGCTRHCATLFHQGAGTSRRAKGARPTVFYDLQNLQESAFSYSRAPRQPYGFSAVVPSEVWVFLSSLGTQQMLISRREYDEVVSASHCLCRLS